MATQECGMGEAGVIDHQKDKIVIIAEPAAHWRFAILSRWRT